jgi:hypothetical protein
MEIIVYKTLKLLVMKNILYAFCLIALALTACDPIEKRDSIGGAITASELDVSATPIVVNGKNGNMVILENKSPVLSSWDCGGSTSLKAYDTVMVVSTGTVSVTYTGLNPDGTKISKAFTIEIDTLSTLPDEYKYLFGDPSAGESSKKFVWDETQSAVWGNGGYLGSTAPGWWTNTKATMDTNDPDYGADGYMLFTLAGMKLKKSNASGTNSVTGTASLDLTTVIYDSNSAVWASCKLNTSNVTVLCGRQPNNNDEPIYDYDVLELNSTKLVLAWPEGGDAASAWSTAWFWMFRVADN